MNNRFVEKLIQNEIATQPYSDVDWITKILNKLPAKYSPSFMSLISRYIFDDFTIDQLWFYANRGDYEWEELAVAVFRDIILFNVTSSNGFLYFARPADGSYDPICFDIRDKKKENIQLSGLIMKQYSDLNE